MNDIVVPRWLRLYLLAICVGVAAFGIWSLR
jgi:hypothetical protein